MHRYLRFSEAVERELITSPLRKGQVYYNTLQEMYPDLANRIVGGYRDPFYDDRIIPDFIEWVYLQLREEC